MTWIETLAATFGPNVDPGLGPPTVDVPSREWRQSLAIARDRLGCALFDFLTAVDVLDEGFWVVAHVARPPDATTSLASVLIRTHVGREDPEVACSCDVYAGASWHERETHEMFGIGFAGHRNLDPLLLPEQFVGHPLRKDFVLASRVAKPWPGAKEPGESEGDAAPSRRRTRPPGVPDPDEWPGV